MKSYGYIFLFTLAIVLGSCSDDEMEVEQLITIEQFISNHNIQTDTTTPSGLQVSIQEEGDSTYPSSNSTVTVRYIGYFTNGAVFDQAQNPVTFELSRTIEGWKEGIPLIQRGGRGTLFIPYELAYGSRGSGVIPPNADLIFEVQILDFE